jgi:hypothetical protein
MRSQGGMGKSDSMWINQVFSLNDKLSTNASHADSKLFNTFAVA